MEHTFHRSLQVVLLILIQFSMKSSPLHKAKKKQKNNEHVIFKMKQVSIGDWLTFPESSTWEIVLSWSPSPQKACPFLGESSHYNEEIGSPKNMSLGVKDWLLYPLKFLCWNPNSQCNCIMMWGLWKVMRSLGYHPHEWY